MSNFAQPSQIYHFWLRLAKLGGWGSGDFLIAVELFEKIIIQAMEFNLSVFDLKLHATRMMHLL